MKPTTSKKPGQSGSADSPRREHTYVQMPTALLCLPTGERAAAIEVWAALHYHLRLGSSPRRITDEELAGVPWLVERSAEHGRKGLEILERLGLISREAVGSSRRVAIMARLRGGRNQKEIVAHEKVGSPQGVASSIGNKQETIRTPLRDEQFTPEEIALAKRLFPKRCAGLVVPTD